MKQSPFAANDA